MLWQARQDVVMTKNARVFVVRCPYCSAQIGQGCRYTGRDGRPRSIAPHAARIKACRAIDPALPDLGDQLSFAVFERATELMAQWLARFRDEGATPTENDLLTAGHLAGALAAQNLLARALPATAQRSQEPQTTARNVPSAAIILLACTNARRLARTFRTDKHQSRTGARCRIILPKPSKRCAAR